MEEPNDQGLARLNTDLVQHEAARPLTRPLILDIDSSESPVHGQDGDGLAATLRPGNLHSADGWEKTLLPVIERSQARGQAVVVRADAAFALPALSEALERWNAVAPQGHRVQPRQSPAPDRPAPCYPELVPDEPPTAAV